MELRANYIIVGLFALTILLGGVGFTLWVTSKGDGVVMSEYDISFSESVKGLSVNSDVLFIGIRVGRVAAIKISDVNPGEVRVRVAISADTPVRKNSTAQLEAMGITGVSVVSISGGSADSPLLQVPEGAVGEIPTAPSTLSSVVSQMPEVLTSANRVLQSIGEVFSKQNVQSVSNTLASLEKVSTMLEKRAGTIDSILAESDNMVRNFSLLAGNANEALVTDVKATTKSMNRIATRVDNTLNMMEPGLKQFSSQGLNDFRMLMVEMRTLVHSLTRVSQKLESDPRRFFFGEQTQEYQSR